LQQIFLQLYLLVVQNGVRKLFCVDIVIKKTFSSVGDDWLLKNLVDIDATTDIDN